MAIKIINRATKIYQILPCELALKLMKCKSKPNNFGPWFVRRSLKWIKSLVGKKSVSCPWPPLDVSPVIMLAIRGERPIKKPVAAIIVCFFE